MPLWFRRRRRPDGFVAKSDEDLHDRIDEVLVQFIETGGANFEDLYTKESNGSLRLFKALLDRLEARRGDFDGDTNGIYASASGRSANCFRTLLVPFERMAMRKLDFEENDVRRLLTLRLQIKDWQAPLSWKRCTLLTERFLEQRELPPGLRSLARECLSRYDSPTWSEHEELQRRWRTILEGPTKAESNPLNLPYEEGDTYLVAHAMTARAARPSERWRRKARELVGNGDQLERLLDLIPERTADPSIANTLRGILWIAGEVDGLEAQLGDIAAYCFTKEPGYGPRSTKLGNAALIALGRRGAVPQLLRLRARLKYASARRVIEEALDDAAASAGLTREELAEIATPTFGFDDSGVWTEEIGEVTAQIELPSSTEVALRFETGGKRRKSVPVAVRRDHPNRLKALRAEVRELKGLLPSLRSRLEGLLAVPRTWELETWRERYLDHPMLRHIARRLIWSIDGQSCAWNGSQLVDLDGSIVEGREVTLWSPIDAETATVRHWRSWLTENEVRQPFKQAHREVYLLTPAERRSELYSNRFAGHVLKQHQLKALGEQRGWSVGLMGAFDSHYTPKKTLDDTWHVEYRVDFIDEESTEAGIFLYVSTDQVRFFRNGECVSLAEVPPRLFSESLRDIDLFVGVASIGHDPTWSDQGPFGDYWRHQAWGDLSEAGRGRREVLEQLLPKLAIADRCELTEKYLVVRGRRNTYRIHLGSANVLMEPDSRYLCIVEGSSTRANKLFLPFEGDHRLTTILSKALLLAEDDRIEDPTIQAQLLR